MHCIQNITDSLLWLGGSDRRISLFEGAHPTPRGMAYNSYLLLDEKTALIDTVDRAVAGQFFENLEAALNGRALDYLVVQHMEPDHSATLGCLLAKHPEAQVICTAKAVPMMRQFGHDVSDARVRTVKEGDTLSLGAHTLRFLMAPMVHWPEVMVTYEEADRTLFSADAFGLFGALDGGIFADEADFDGFWLDEARRYYTNIVGKYGPSVQTLLKKAAALEIARICPLHGFIWRKDLDKIVSKYDLWSRYAPEERGVLVAYASVYGNTANAAEAVANRLRAKGVRCEARDVSVTDDSELVAAAFRWSHWLLAAPTYNAGVFVAMENALRDVAAHGLQGRSVALIQNGSWAPASANQMKEMLSGLKNMTFLEPVLTVRGALAPAQAEEVDAFAQAIADSVEAAQ
ncbi:MAG: MBL fold metallo-hydrolase [Clostridia bacterium]|nr:MBL fold metallo-hydrolase [Clostridia bacterium]